MKSARSIEKRKQVTKIKTQIRGRMQTSSFTITEPFQANGHIVIP